MKLVQKQYNCIEVGFKDRFDNFAPKIEVIEKLKQIPDKKKKEVIYENKHN